MKRLSIPSLESTVALLVAHGCRRRGYEPNKRVRDLALSKVRKVTAKQMQKLGAQDALINAVVAAINEYEARI